MAEDGKGRELGMAKGPKVGQQGWRQWAVEAES